MAREQDYMFGDFITESRHASQLIRFYFTGAHNARPEYKELGKNLVIVSVGLEQLDDEGRNDNSVIFDDDDDVSAVLDVANRVGDFKRTLFDLDQILRRLWSENRGKGAVWDKLRKPEDVAEIQRLLDLMKSHGKMIQRVLNRKFEIHEDASFRYDEWYTSRHASFPSSPVTRSKTTSISSGPYLGEEISLDRQNSSSTRHVESSRSTVSPDVFQKDLLQAQLDAPGERVRMLIGDDSACNDPVDVTAFHRQTTMSYTNDDEYYLNPQYYGKGRQQVADSALDLATDSGNRETLIIRTTASSILPYVDSQSSASSIYSERSLSKPNIQRKEVPVRGVLENATSSVAAIISPVQPNHESFELGPRRAYTRSSFVSAQSSINPVNEQEHETIQNLQDLRLPDRALSLHETSLLSDTSQSVQVSSPRGGSGMIKTSLGKSDLGFDQALSLELEVAFDVQRTYHRAKARIRKNHINGDVQIELTVLNSETGPHVWVEKFKRQETELIPDYGFGVDDKPTIYLRELRDFTPLKRTASNKMADAQTHTLPASLICRFSNVEDLHKFQGKLMDETIRLDIPCVHHIQLKDQDKKHRRVRLMYNVRIQLWHDKPDFSTALTKDQDDVLEEEVAAAESEHPTLKWSRMVVYLGRPNGFLSIFVTDRIVLEQRGNALLMKGHRPFPVMPREMLKAKEVGDSNTSDKGKLTKGGMRLDRHGLMPLDEKSFSSFERIEFEFENTDQLEEFQRVWKELMKDRKKQLAKIEEFERMVEEKHPVVFFGN